MPPDMIRMSMGYKSEILVPLWIQPEIMRGEIDPVFIMHIDHARKLSQGSFDNRENFKLSHWLETAFI